ncbi:MAG: glycosyltransferase [Promethearchaeota archaeon]
MLSIVCVYNNKRILNSILLKSLKNQTAEFETIILDNRKNRFKSAAEALNFGGEKTKGDYIIFAHQDMWLGPDSWLENLEKTLQDLPDLGIAGVAGMSEYGGTWEDRCSWAIFRENPGIKGEVTKPEEVQTLDECLLIIPKEVFQKLKFDEKTFNGWHCYGTDYCLLVKRLDLKVYVVPGKCSHCCMGAKNSEFKGLIEYENRLYFKHKESHKQIFTWMGVTNWKKVIFYPITKKFEAVLDFFNRYLDLFPDFVEITKKELYGCKSILDLGCGYLSPIQHLNFPFSVGVELFGPYLQESKKMDIHNHYIWGDIQLLEFRPKSFDAVVLYEVLEYLTKEEGELLLQKMEKWAKKKIIILTPNKNSKRIKNTFNPFNKYKSGWGVKELKKLGYNVQGFYGWKKLRGLDGAIRFKPSYLVGILSNFTERITHNHPKLAYELCAIKTISETK